MTGRRTDGPLRVLLISPAGRGGAGGIDRLMDSVVDAFEAGHGGNVEIERIVSRGPNAVATLWMLPLALLRIAGARLAGRADVVHVNLSSYGSAWRKIVIANFSRLLRLPYVVHLHGSEFREFWTGSTGLKRRLIDGLFAHAQRIALLGTPWAALVREMVPRAGGRIALLPNATATGERGPRGDGPAHILFIGELGNRKGTPQLVEALARLRTRKGWRATIAGNGAVEETRKAAAGHGLKHVAIPGWVGPAGVAGLLADADILVLPSFNENLPMSVIEGMAHGLAVVATPVGATGDIVRDGDTGLLVEPGDVAALAGALSRLVDDKALRERLGRNAHAFQRENLEIGSYAARLADLWRAAARREEPAAYPAAEPLEPAQRR